MIQLKPIFGFQVAYQRFKDAPRPKPLKLVLHPQTIPAHTVELRDDLVGRLVKTAWAVAGKVGGEVLVSTKTVDDAHWVWIFVVPSKVAPKPT